MKTGKSTSVMSIGTVNYGPLASKQVPAWQARRRNRSAMPRPKSTGYLKDFNILSEEDDIEDDTNRPYDDSVLTRNVDQRVDCILPRDVPANQGCYHNDISMNGNVSRNYRNRCVPNGDLNEQGDRAVARDVRSRDAYVLTRDVSGRAAYWQRREDESKKVPERASTSSITRNWKTPGQIRQLRDEVDPTQMTQFIYDHGVANRAAMWQKLEDDHFEQMMINPDKEWKGPVKWVVLDKDHPEYGRPPKGSKTETRGIKAHKHVVKEIGELCQIIAENGERQKDGTVTITFRKLFHTYVPISNKVVGILIRARKRGLLHFNGEMLYQRQDEDEIIQLFPMTDVLE